MMIGSKMSMAVKKERKVASYTSPLPPCKICGAKASGLHYGVNTCEACKGFFRRAVKCQKKYRCFRQQKCDVTGGRSVRTSCPFCRLQKCLDMGMAHTAIKTGRYTHAKRTENIMEVKRLEQYQKMPPVNSAGDTSLDSTHSGNRFEYYQEPHQEQNLKAQSLNSSCNWLDSFTALKKEEKHDFSSSFAFSNTIQTDSVGKESDTYSMYPDKHYGICSHSEPSGSSNLQMEEILPHLLVQGLVHGVSIDADEVCKSLTIQTPVTNVQNNTSETEGVYISIPTPPLGSDLSLSSPLLEESASPEDLSLNSSSSPPTSETKASEVSNIPLMEFSKQMPSVSPDFTTLTPVLSPTKEMSASPDLLMSTQDIKTMPVPGMLSPASSVSSSFASELSPPPQLSPSMFSPVDRHQLIIRKLMEAHREHTITLVEMDKEVIYQKQMKYIENHEVKTEAFGYMTPFLSDDIYHEIFALTGLDVDNRNGRMGAVTNSLDHLLRCQSRFARCIPGFSQLTTGDQIKLISSAYKESWFLNAYFGMNREAGVILMPNQDCYNKSEFSWLMTENFNEKCFEIASYFQNLNIDYELLVLWKVVLLLVTDREELDEPQKVSLLQEFYVECLQEHIKLTRPKDNKLFRDIIFNSLRLRDMDNTMITPLSIPMSHLHMVVRTVLEEEQSSFNS